MLLNDNVSKARAISAKISEKEQDLIKAYIQGAIYCFCKNCPNDNGVGSKPFHARDLFGGENYFWEETPLFVLFDWHRNNGANNPQNEAGKDVGHLMSAVIQNDKRVFTLNRGYTNQYQWTGEERACE